MNVTHLKLILHNTSDRQGGKPFTDTQRVMFSSSAIYTETEVGKITEQVLPASIHYVHRTMTLEASQDTQEYGTCVCRVTEHMGEK